MAKLCNHEWKRNADYTYTCTRCGMDIINGTPAQHGYKDNYNPKK